MSKWYGNLDNRLMEGSRQPELITVGMGATEIFYSDRHAYEVIEVKDQKHVTIRQYDAKTKGAYSNEWELTSNENNTAVELTKRGNYWYAVWTITKQKLEALGVYKNEKGCYTTDDNDNLRTLWNYEMHGIDIDKVFEKGKQTKYSKRNIVFGIADEYYDYEF